MEDEREARLKDLERLARTRTDQLRLFADLNLELVQALQTVRSHLGKKELAVLERAEKSVSGE